MNYEIDEGEPVSEAVIFAVSAFENRSPCTLDALSATLDSDALDILFEASPDPHSRGARSFSFVYSHSHVMIHDGEVIEVWPADAAASVHPR